MTHQCPKCASPNFISLQVLFNAGDKEVGKKHRHPGSFGILTFLIFLIIGGALVFVRHPISVILGAMFLLSALGMVCGRKENAKKYLEWTRSYRCSKCKHVFVMNEQ